MGYPIVAKTLARRLPILGRVIRQRDEIWQTLQQTRAELSELTVDLAKATALLREREAGQGRGYCHCCRRQTVFEIRDPWLRDHYICTICQSIPRQRHIQYLLDTCFPQWESQVIHESSPSNGFIAQWCSSYSSSHFYVERPPGSMVDGVRCENLEALAFPDALFDIFITQDVLEHVFHPDRALAEITRVLKPGGVHIFTTPKYRDKPKSYPRARLSADGEVTYLMEAQYHGNPIGDGRSLVTWDYGRDFEVLAAEWAGAPTVTYITKDRSLGLDAEFIEVFVTRKPDAG
ncbi:class I SAM-dependent methyltransferase [Bordetella bronchialis]|uniref:class I SAM-dependent methyltransferase n=1 Tax=Bordetella bronchialis TaxID=463025 RepID=UPI003D08D2C0